MKDRASTIRSVSCCTMTLLGVMACAQQPTYRSPDGYDLNHPVKYEMPASLHEISGITFDKGDPKKIYAEEDEHGRVYTLHPGDENAIYTQFKETGDFEDIAICNGIIIMLQSKGRLYTLPQADIGKQQVSDAKQWDNLLPNGEYEGMYADQKENEVYVLCKHCSEDKTSKQATGYIFRLRTDGTLLQVGQFTINVKHIADLTGDDKIQFHPSALSWNPATNEWYILSSVNRMLVVTDGAWKIRQVYKLNQDIFNQPEGMAFDRGNNLYISNEGQVNAPGNILKFSYKKH